MDKKSILTAHPITAKTPASTGLPKVGWDVEKFNGLIYNNGYDAYIERALRCPCVDRSTGQALSTCKNCLGRGWFFVDKRETRLIAQSMDNTRRNSDIGEINRGTARITTRAVDRLAFMDKIILLDLEAYYSEILRPFFFEEELIAYPIYEPLKVTNMFMYVGDSTKLLPISENLYSVQGNKIVFDESILHSLEVTDINQTQPDLSISVRYSYNPVYHIIDANRELMKVRERKCSPSDDELINMPISALARKAHFIFDRQTFGQELFDNSVIEEL